METGIFVIIVSRASEQPVCPFLGSILPAAEKVTVALDRVMRGVRPLGTDRQWLVLLAG